MTLKHWVLWTLLFGLMNSIVHAHEMGTSALSLKEYSLGQGQLVLKRSRAASGELAPIEFSFTPHCEVLAQDVLWESDNEVYQHAQFKCSGPLTEHTLRIQGFVRLSPDLILQAQLLDQPPRHWVLNPQNPTVSFAEKERPALPLYRYLSMGIEHIVWGLDHVLFVTALVLLWHRARQNPRRLVIQFSWFTVGHSITLALLTLGYLVVPTQLVEALIALSVLYLAMLLTLPPPVEQPPQRQESVLIVLFGLLHGSGFALSMSDQGFPQEQLASALLLFNVGIEVGQLLIVGGVLAFLKLADYTLNTRFAAHVQQGLVVGLGGFALFWTLERMAPYVQH